MGYGEFVGGGSVDWEITHTNGDHGSGGKAGGKGKDKDPANATGGVFTMWAINQKTGQGTIYGPFLVDDYKIKLEWGPRSGAQSAPAMAMKSARKRK